MTGRGLVGRRTAKALLIVTLVLDGLAAALLLSRPNDMGPMFAGPPEPAFGLLIVAAGVVLNLIGLVWMVRIIRADPEAHASSWRATRGR